MAPREELRIANSVADRRAVADAIGVIASPTDYGWNFGDYEWPVSLRVGHRPWSSTQVGEAHVTVVMLAASRKLPRRAR